jgi:quercetin dioxygenase-like cupin family protein
VDRNGNGTPSIAGIKTESVQSYYNIILNNNKDYTKILNYRHSIMKNLHRLMILALLIPCLIATGNKSDAQGLSNKIFGSVLQDKLNWAAFPAFPPEARIAIVVGNPNLSEPYVVRVKLPGGVKLMPHTHPEDRIYTVMSGTFYIGLGKIFDEDKLKAYPPGSVIILPGNTPHFHWSRSGEYITQVTAHGPLGINYINPLDDPRKKKK